MGTVSLSDGALGAHFDAGRLTGLAWNGRPVTPLEPARSYAGPAARPRQYEVANAFALEADRLRGLRCLHRLAGEPAPLSLEYFFVEDFQFLLVTGRVRYPRRRGLERVSPLEIAIARLPEGEAVTVHVLSRGEAPYEVRMADGAPPTLPLGQPLLVRGERGGRAGGLPAGQGAGSRERVAPARNAGAPGACCSRRSSRASIARRRSSGGRSCSPSTSVWPSRRRSRCRPFRARSSTRSPTTHSGNSPGPALRARLTQSTAAGC